MIKYMNPYTPGKGFMPSYIAGRDAIITEAVQTAASAIRFLKNFEEKNNG